MPQLACNPILVSLTGLQVNKVTRVTVTIETENRSPQEYVIHQLYMRANNAGKVENYDLSPVVAAFIRKTFDGSKEAYGGENIKYFQGPNVYHYRVSISGITEQASAVLFGVGEVPAAELSSPYLLRRNTAAIHVYDGLPGALSTYGKFSLVVMDSRLVVVKSISGGTSSGYVNQHPYDRLGLPVGNYYLVGGGAVKTTVWDDTRIWTDMEVWHESYIEDNNHALIYPLHVHASPADCIRGGAKIYIRYWNSRGAWSYALLSVLHNDLKAKTEYADSWRLDAKPVDGRILGDRVQTSKEMTYMITAGRDGLNRLEVDELRDLQRAWCVQVWDIDQEVWRDCYVDDATTQNNGGCRQEMTFTIEMPHEYTFTR